MLFQKLEVLEKEHKELTTQKSLLEVIKYVFLLQLSNFNCVITL